jgi:hypothetical protein
MMRRRHARWLALGAAAWLAGCGDDVQAPSGRSMSEAASAQRASGAPNTPPQVTSLALVPSELQAGRPVRAQATVVDAERDATRVGYTWRIDGVVVTDVVGDTLTVPALARDAEIQVEAIASDGSAQSEPRTVSARVRNRVPEIASVQLEPREGFRAGDTVVAVVDASDPDGDAVALSHQWFVNGRPVERDDDGARFDTTGLKRGDQVAVRVVASDEDDESEAVDTPSLVASNTAPKITSQPPAGMGAEGVYRYAVEAKDPDGDRALRFRLGAAPEGAKIDPMLGEITWKPSFQQAGKHAVEVVVSDGHGGETTQRFEVTVRAIEEAAAPPAAAAP